MWRYQQMWTPLFSNVGNKWTNVMLLHLNHRKEGQTGHFETSPPTLSVPPTRNDHGTVSNFENPTSLIIIVQFISLSSLSPTFGGHKMERQITDFFPHKPSYHIALPQPLLSSILWRGQCLTTRLSRSEKT